MNKYIKMATPVAATAVYYAILRYAAPSNDPYFILGLGLIGYVAWLYGIVAGLVMGILLVPLTLFVYGQFDVSFSYVRFASSPAYLGVELLAAFALGRLRKKNLLLSQKEEILAETNEHLQTVLAQVQELGGVHSICTSCQKIQDDDGDWMKIDTYLLEKTKIEFSHGICPDCTGQYNDKTAE